MNYCNALHNAIAAYGHTLNITYVNSISAGRLLILLFPFTYPSIHLNALMSIILTFYFYQTFYLLFKQTLYFKCSIYNSNILASVLSIQPPLYPFIHSF